MRQPAPTRLRQRGVAVITALLLTTLAITIVASLFWQQQVQVRSIENHYLHLQQKWILRSAVDWSLRILSEDAKAGTWDYLDEAWAAPMTVTQLDDFLGDSGGSATTATLSGNIIDAQSRYNLRNLALDGKTQREEVAVFRRLLTLLKLSPSWAQMTADAMAATQKGYRQRSGAVEEVEQGAEPVTASFFINIEQLDDLLALPGMTPAILSKLRDHVVMLPIPTTINANTATAPVLAAKFPSLTVEEAAAIIASRKHVYMRDGADLSGRTANKVTPEEANLVQFGSGFFLVNRKVKINRASMEVQALIERNPMIGTRILWIREK